MLLVSEIHTNGRKNKWSFAPATLKERRADLSTTWRVTTAAAWKVALPPRAHPCRAQTPRGATQTYEEWNQALGLVSLQGLLQGGSLHGELAIGRDRF